MRGATRVTLQLHQILRLPRKMNLIIDQPHIWHVIYNARTKQSHPPTSPNSAPATQNQSHHWSTSHMTRHLQCAEQQESPSNFTKYCACHTKSMSLHSIVAALQLPHPFSIGDAQMVLPIQTNYLLYKPWRKLPFSPISHTNPFSYQVWREWLTRPSFKINPCQIPFWGSMEVFGAGGGQNTKGLLGRHWIALTWRYWTAFNPRHFTPL